MRPCNQCRKPVENSVFICAACEQYNDEHGLEPPTMVGLEENPPELPPSRRDYSYTLMMLFFTAVVTAIGALTGFAISGRPGLVPGAILGFIFGACFLISAR